MHVFETGVCVDVCCVKRNTSNARILVQIRGREWDAGGEGLQASIKYALTQTFVAAVSNHMCMCEQCRAYRL